MSFLRIKNIVVYLLAALIGFALLYYYKQRDDKIASLWERNKYTTDSIYATAEEKQIAQTFSDSILPALKEKGLITAIEQNDIHIIIIVNKAVWSERSIFFKEQFLQHCSIYVKVNGFTESALIVDNAEKKILAEVLPYGRKIVYE